MNMHIGMNQFTPGDSDVELLKSLAGDERYADNDELAKALNKQGLVQRDVTVQGANGKTFTRKQWVKASDAAASGQQSQGQPAQAVDDAAAKQKATHMLNNCDVGDTLGSGDHTISIGRQKNINTGDWEITYTQKSTGKTLSYAEAVKVLSQSFTSQTPKTQAAPTGISFDKPTDGDAKKAVMNLLASGKSRGDIMTAAKAAGITWKENDHEGINWMRASMAIQKHMAGGVTTPAAQPDVQSIKPTPAPVASTSTKPVADMTSDEIEQTPEFATIQGILRNGRKYKAIELTRECLSVLRGEQDVSERVSLMDIHSFSTRAGVSPTEYKEDCQDYPKAIKALGLQCKVIDTSTHHPGYNTVRGQRQYAYTTKSKSILIFKKEMSQKPYEDKGEIGSHVLYVRDGKIEHGIITVESKDYKPGVCLIQPPEWGSQLREVALREIKGDWDKKQEFIRQDYIGPSNPNFDPNKNNGYSYRVNRLYGTHFSTQSDADKKKMIDEAEKLPASVTNDIDFW